MKFKYPEVEIVVQSVDGLDAESLNIFDENFDFAGRIKVGDKAKIRHIVHSGNPSYEIVCDDGASEYLIESEMDIIVGDQLNNKENTIGNFNVKINAEIDSESLAEIHILLDELENRLKNLKVNLKIV